MRRGFSLITAIFVIVLMATVSVLILNLAGKNVKLTTYQYRGEQAAILAKSYTELAIMYAMSNDSNTSPCAEDINGVVGGNTNEGKGYDVQVRISYIGNGLACSSTRILNDQTVPIVTPHEKQIVVDVYVRYKDPDIIGISGSAAAVPWLTYHRRTLQKL